MSEFTHCHHDRLYIDECDGCQKEWLVRVTIPSIRDKIPQLRQHFTEAEIQTMLFDANCPPATGEAA